MKARMSSKEENKVRRREREKDARVSAVKGRWSGSTEHRALSLFVGKCLRDGSLVTEFVLIHQSQQNTINL